MDKSTGGGLNPIFPVRIFLPLFRLYDEAQKFAMLSMKRVLFWSGDTGIK